MKTEIKEKFNLLVDLSGYKLTFNKNKKGYMLFSVNGGDMFPNRVNETEFLEALKMFIDHFTKPKPLLTKGHLGLFNGEKG